MSTYESKLTAIADAIRSKKGTTELIKASNFASEIMSIDTSGGGGSGGSLREYDFSMDNIVDGKWVCPDNWDDPYNGGGTPVARTSQVLYLVYRCDTTAFYAVACNVAYTAEIGHFVNGQFVSLSSASKSANAVFSGTFTNDKATSGKDTFVIKLTSASNITSFTMPNTSYNGHTYDGTYQYCVMRYGNMPNMTSLANLPYYADVEDIINHKVTTLTSHYSGRTLLKKVRVDGIKPTKIIFSNCVSLVDHNFEVLDTSNITDMSSMFYACYSLRSIDVSNFSTSKVTTLGGWFENCYNLTEIKGVDKLAFPKCTNYYHTFYNCQSLAGDLDLSGWGATNITNSNALAAMFSGCKRIKSVDLSGWNVSSAARCDAMFSGCNSLESVKALNCVTPTSGSGKLVNANNMFRYCNNLKSIDGIPAWLVNVYNWLDIFNECYSIKSIDFGDVTLSGTTSSNNMIARMFSYCRQLKELDLSTLDLSKYTYSGNQHDIVSGCYNLVDFYPPQNINYCINLSTCAMLSRDSLLRVLSNLVAPKGTTTALKTYTFGAMNLSKLTDDEKAIATNLGWTLA